MTRPLLAGSARKRFIWASARVSPASAITNSPPASASRMSRAASGRRAATTTDRASSAEAGAWGRLTHSIRKG